MVSTPSSCWRELWPEDALTLTVSTPTRKGYYSMSPSLLDMSEFKPSARPQTLSKATPNTKHQEKSTPTSNNTNNIGNASTLITNAEPKNLVNASKTIKEESEKEDTANATPGTKKCPNCGTMV